MASRSASLLDGRHYAEAGRGTRIPGQAGRVSRQVHKVLGPAQPLKRWVRPVAGGVEALELRVPRDQSQHLLPGLGHQFLKRDLADDSVAVRAPGAGAAGGGRQQ